ncbi:nesprin-2 isoform X2, partial [Clarias magur]
MKIRVSNSLSKLGHHLSDLQFQSQTLQSQPQLQVLQKPQLPGKEQPQQQSITLVTPPPLAPARPQGAAQLQPQTQQPPRPQNRAEVPFQVQIQSQTQLHIEGLQKPQLPEQEQHQQQTLTQAKLPALAPERPPSPAPQQPQTQYQERPQNRAEALFQVQIPSQTLQTPSQVQGLQKTQFPVPEERQQHLVARVKPPPQDQACLQACSEAEALAKTKFEDAKRCLQEHILEAINIFKGKKATQKQQSFDLLKEFLKAVQGMGTFRTPSQLQDLELFTQSVRTQWEACFSASSSLVPAEQQLEALKQLCASLSPEDANRLAQVQLGESETTLAAIQCPSSGDQDMTPTDAGVLVEQIQTSQQKPALLQKSVEISTEIFPVSAQQPKTVEKKAILKQISTEEDRYRSSRFALQAQLNRNEQNMLGDRPSGSASATDLQRRLRELKDETECLWSEYEAQCSQCSQVNERAMEQDRAEITVKYREQRAQLQR